jgi:ferredoxin-NADP reductase
MVTAMARLIALSQHDIYVAGPEAFVEAAGAALAEAGAAPARLFVTVV